MKLYIKRSESSDFEKAKVEIESVEDLALLLMALDIAIQDEEQLLVHTQDEKLKQQVITRVSGYKRILQMLNDENEIEWDGK